MIEVKNLSKQFGDNVLFKSLNLQFDFGKLYCIRGRSGCGKTTLLNMIGKLEKVDAGEILYQGQNLEEFKSHEFFRHKLGYLFQNYGLMESRTIEDNLNLGLVGVKISKDEKKARQRQALNEVGLNYLELDQHIYQLSGGEAQRVALAKLFLKEPPLILADEPTASLDPKTGQEIMELLLSLKSPERLIVIASHEPKIWTLADELISLPDPQERRALGLTA